MPPGSSHLQLILDSEVIFLEIKPWNYKQAQHNKIAKQNQQEQVPCAWKLTACEHWLGYSSGWLAFGRGRGRARPRPPSTWGRAPKAALIYLPACQALPLLHLLLFLSRFEKGGNRSEELAWRGTERSMVARALASLHTSSFLNSWKSSGGGWVEPGRPKANASIGLMDCPVLWYTNDCAPAHIPFISKKLAQELHKL